MTEPTGADTLALTTDITVVWLSNLKNRVGTNDVLDFLSRIHSRLARLADGQAADIPNADTSAATVYAPAVSVRRSLASPDHIVSMIDGKAYRALRRRIAAHGLTLEQYRERYNLKTDYPMTAPNYSKLRSQMAKGIGLGQQRRSAATGTGKSTADRKRTPSKASE